jgi:hypothetical protein
MLAPGARAVSAAVDDPGKGAAGGICALAFAVVGDRHRSPDIMCTGMDGAEYPPQLPMMTTPYGRGRAGSVAGPGGAGVRSALSLMPPSAFQANAAQPAATRRRAAQGPSADRGGRGRGPGGGCGCEVVGCGGGG